MIREYEKWKYLDKLTDSHKEYLLQKIKGAGYFSGESLALEEVIGKYNEELFTKELGNIVKQLGDNDYQIFLTDKGKVYVEYSHPDSGGYDSTQWIRIFDSEEEFRNYFQWF